jgi:hypothetical protein
VWIFDSLVPPTVASCVWQADYKFKGGKGLKGHEYEKAVRFNYDTDDLRALVDVISMIKVPIMSSRPAARWWGC